MNTTGTGKDDCDNIESLIETLKGNDIIARQNARSCLVEIGEPALDALIEAFEIDKYQVHWEVAKALSQIGTPKAAQALVDALEDQDFSVRWIAAEGLIHIGANGLVPLLKALRENTDSVWLREGCHHVIHDLVNRKIVDNEIQECLLPVLDALNHFVAMVETNAAANKALEIIQKKTAG